MCKVSHLRSLSPTSLPPVLNLFLFISLFQLMGSPSLPWHSLDTQNPPQLLPFSIPCLQVGTARGVAPRQHSNLSSLSPLLLPQFQADRLPPLLQQPPTASAPLQRVPFSTAVVIVLKEIFITPSSSGFPLCIMWEAKGIIISSLLLFV